VSERTFCRCCGAQTSPEPSGLGDVPLEEQVVLEGIRERAFVLLKAGIEAQHTVNIAAGFPRRGEEQW